MIRKRFAFCILLIFGLGLVPNGFPAEIRALWVTRYDFKSATDVVRIMENSRYAGANAVFLQVRGNATVFYPSKIEPWAWELTGDSPRTIGVDPGWNPLATAMQEAKKQGLQFHAWMNVFPGWRGAVPAPRGTQHPWVLHRSWFIIDQHGVLLQPTERFYSFLSPGQSQVRAYLASVFSEVAKLYPGLDGIHLDYIRYPGFNEAGRNRDFSYDSESVKAFTQRYKKWPNYALAEWQRFKCEQVEATIRAIRHAVQSASATIQLSATCFANIHTATTEKGQDARDWLKDNLVDWVAPMAYERSVKDLESRLEEWDRFYPESSMKKMIIGINADFNSEREIQKQLDYVYKKKYGGVAIFAYTALFPNHKPNGKARLLQSIWQDAQIREVLKQANQQTAQ